MLRKFIELIIRKLGRQKYQIDEDLSSVQLLKIIIAKGLQCLRGFRLKLFLKKSSGLIFLGRHTKISFKQKIQVGKTFQVGDFVEIHALSRSGIKIGDNVTIHNKSIIDCTGVISNLGEGLIIGNNVGIAQNAFIQVRGKVVIGNDVIIGPNVSIFSENHNFDQLEIPISKQGVSRKGVNIGNGVWLATKVVILDGVTIGENSIVAAGSIVNKDIPANSIYGGIPAKKIKDRS